MDLNGNLTYLWQLARYDGGENERFWSDSNSFWFEWNDSIPVINTLAVYICDINQVIHHRLWFISVIPMYAAYRWTFESFSWLFLCDSDLSLIIEENMIPWEKSGNYEYAKNYCRKRNTKIGHNLGPLSEAVIAYHPVRILLFWPS